MRKLAAISFLLLLLFNFAGYRLVFYTLQQQADKQLEASLDKNNYDYTNLITISVPLSMPYLTNWNDFKRTDGEITFQGKIYHYVKEKVYDGKLILQCLPDEQKMNLQTAKNDFFKLSNDLQNNTASKKAGANVLKQVITDYEKQDIEVQHFHFQSAKQFFANNLSASLQKGETLIPEQPPKA